MHSTERDISSEKPGHQERYRFRHLCLGFLLATLCILCQFTLDAFRVGAYFLVIFLWHTLFETLYRSHWQWRRALLWRRAMLLFDSYVILYIVLFWETYRDITIFLEHEIPSLLSESFVHQAAENISRAFNVTVEDVLKETQLEATIVDSLMLRWIPLLAPFAVLFAGVISSVSSIFHVCSLWPDLKCDDVEHREAWNEARMRRSAVIQINSLPFLYGVMALKGAMRSWEWISGTFMNVMPKDEMITWDGEHSAVELLQTLVETNLSVADAYEAWAVLLFSKLVMSVIRDTSERVADGKLPAQELAKHMSIAMMSIATWGISSFFYSSLATSLYTLILALCQFDDVFLHTDVHLVIGGIDVLNPRHWPPIETFFSGVGNLATCIAISSIMKLEKEFHKELSSMGEVFYKFLSVKILVTLVFTQQLGFSILVYFVGWSKVQSALASSGLLCMECLLLSFWHMYAWSAREKYLAATPMYVWNDREKYLADEGPWNNFEIKLDELKDLGYDLHRQHLELQSYLKLPTSSLPAPEHESLAEPLLNKSSAG